MNTEQERADFEAWYRLHHGSLDVYGRDASGEYADKQVQGAFNVWQARATLAAQKEDDARDAARYRLLRRKVCIAGGEFHILNLDPRCIAPDAAVELDAAIDASLAKVGDA